MRAAPARTSSRRVRPPGTTGHRSVTPTPATRGQPGAAPVRRACSPCLFAVPVRRACSPCLFDSDPIEQGVVAAPVLAHLHLEVQVDAGAELALQLAPRRGPDFPDHPAALADEDALLRRGLDPD